MNKHNPIGTLRTARAALAVLVTPVASAVLALAVGTGCQQKASTPAYVGDEPIGGEIFSGVDDDARSIKRFEHEQAANAARTDATLRRYDFAGSDLNSLGQQKLDLMSSAERGDTPLKVYLDLPQDAEEGTRREAVLVYLKDRGLKEDEIAIEPGPNLSPDNLHPTAQSMKVLHMLDAGAAVGANPGPGAAAPPAAH